MATLKISLPDHLNEFVVSEVASGNYRNVDEFFRDVVESQKLDREVQALEQRMLLEIARQNGDVTDEDHARVRQEIRGRRLAQLRAELQVGIDQADRGEFVEFTAQDIMREGRELLARRKREGKKDGEAA
jgi:Arc/MetJ-type ribon-helix-helix transcriptional regulator